MSVTLTKADERSCLGLCRRWLSLRVSPRQFTATSRPTTNSLFLIAQDSIYAFDDTSGVLLSLKLSKTATTGIISSLKVMRLSCLSTHLVGHSAFSLCFFESVKFVFPISSIRAFIRLAEADKNVDTVPTVPMAFLISGMSQRFVIHWSRSG